MLWIKCPCLFGQENKSSDWLLWWLKMEVLMQNNNFVVSRFSGVLQMAKKILFQKQIKRTSLLCQNRQIDETDYESLFLFQNKKQSEKNLGVRSSSGHLKVLKSNFLKIWMIGWRFNLKSLHCMHCYIILYFSELTQTNSLKQTLRSGRCYWHVLSFSILKDIKWDSRKFHHFLLLI